MMRSGSTKALLEADRLSVAFGDTQVLHDVSLRLKPERCWASPAKRGPVNRPWPARRSTCCPARAASAAARFWPMGRTCRRCRPNSSAGCGAGVVPLIGTDAESLLDPVRAVGEQAADVPRAHKGLSTAKARQEAIPLFTKVGIADPEKRAEAYPRQLSGGMAQRVVIAMALMAEPRIILADDATSGLDATIRVQVLDLPVERCRAADRGAIILAHDLGIVARYCGRLAIMRKGRIAQEGPTPAFLHRPAATCGAQLLQSARARPAPATRTDQAGGRDAARPIPEVRAPAFLTAAEGWGGVGLTGIPPLNRSLLCH